MLRNSSILSNVTFLLLRIIEIRSLNSAITIVLSNYYRNTYITLHFHHLLMYFSQFLVLYVRRVLHVLYRFGYSDHGGNFHHDSDGVEKRWTFEKVVVVVMTVEAQGWKSETGESFPRGNSAKLPRSLILQFIGRQIDVCTCRIRTSVYSLPCTSHGHTFM